MERRNRQNKLTPVEQTRLATQIRARGLPAVLSAADGALSASAVTNAVAGLAVHRATVFVLRSALTKLEADDTRLQLAEELARGEEGGES